MAIAVFGIARTIRIRDQREIAANRAPGGFARIGRPEQITHTLHDVVALQSHHDHRARAHELLQPRIERPVGHVRVMLAEQRRGQPGHFTANDVEARLLKAVDYVPDMPLFHAIGFEDDQRSLHKYGPARYQRLVAREARSSLGQHDSALGGRNRDQPILQEVTEETERMDP